MVHSHVAADGDTAAEAEEGLRLMPQNPFEHGSLLQGYRGTDALVFRASRENLPQGEIAQGVKSNISIFFLWLPQVLELFPALLGKVVNFFWKTH